MRIYYFWISSCSFDRIEWIERERIKCWNSIKIDKTKYSECNVVVHRKSCWSTEEFSISSHTFENANRREQRKRICYFNMIYQRFAIEKCICILVLICSVRERERETRFIWFANCSLWFCVFFLLFTRFSTRSFSYNQSSNLSYKVPSYSILFITHSTFTLTQSLPYFHITWSNSIFSMLI